MTLFGSWLKTNTIPGVVDETLAPGKRWRIKVHGVYWSAATLTGATFSPGEHVEVVERRNNTLLIQSV